MVSLLFLAAGSVIHGFYETQDMPDGGLRRAMPTNILDSTCSARLRSVASFPCRLLVQG